MGCKLAVMHTCTCFPSKILCSLSGGLLMICCFVSLLAKSTLLISKLQQGTMFFKTRDDVYQLQI